MEYAIFGIAKQGLGPRLDELKQQLFGSAITRIRGAAILQRPLVASRASAFDSMETKRARLNRMKVEKHEVESAITSTREQLSKASLRERLNVARSEDASSISIRRRLQQLHAKRADIFTAIAQLELSINGR